MSNLFTYSDVTPRVQFYNNSTEFTVKLLKTSESKNNTFEPAPGSLAKLLGQKIKLEGTEQLKAEIATGKSFNSKQQCEFLVDSFPHKTCFHKGYFEYLLSAWHNDCGIQVGPWDLWSIIMHQINTILQENGNECKTIWTKSGEKEQIVMDKFDIHQFIEKIQKQIPFDTD